MSDANPKPVIALKDLAVGYDGVAVMSDIDLEVAPGEIIALCGGSGSGKTTLLRTMIGLLPPSPATSRSRARRSISKTTSRSSHCVGATASCISSARCSAG
jgi:ABC-type transporter Mla maintaining outer membrane lipid asymmetry ATPase subunit MlaF